MEIIKNLEILLESPEEVNQILALEILGQKDIAKALLTPIYFRYRTSRNEEIKQKTLQLIKKYGSPALVNLLRYRKLLRATYAEIAFERLFEKYTEGTEIDQDKFLLLYYTHFRQGKGLLFKSTTIQPALILKTIIRKKNLRVFGYDINLISPYLKNHIDLIALYYEHKTEYIPKGVFDLINLRTLSIRTANIKQNLTGLSKLKRLEDLIIYGYDLPQIDSEIFELKNLKTLELCQRQLIAVPKELLNLKNLESLEFSSSRISSLPDIGQLPKLKTFIFSLINNRRKKKVDFSAITTCKALKGISLISNDWLTEVPDFIKNCPVLGYLNLMDCPNIKELPDFIVALKTLEVIDIVGTGITELPKDFNTLCNLKKIYVSADLKEKIIADKIELPPNCTLITSK